MGRTKIKIFFGYVSLQMGKDVVSFLSWAAEPEMEERKLVCFMYYHFYLGSIKKIPCVLRTLLPYADGI